MGILQDVAAQIMAGELAERDAAIAEFGNKLVREAESRGLLQERIAELEFAQEDAGWMKLDSSEDGEFSRVALTNISKSARLAYLKNPLVRRAVDMKANYTFGQGVTFKAQHPLVQEVIDHFAEVNKDILFTMDGQMARDVELQLDGNLFAVFFVNKVTGTTRARFIPFAEITEVICNPDDRSEPWFYRRVWSQKKAADSNVVESREELYADYRYNPKGGIPKNFDGKPVREERIMHIKTGQLPHMRFGVSEVYPALDWARAYKEFLEDWATIVRSLSRFAWKMTSKAGKAGIEAGKSALTNKYTANAAADSKVLPPSSGSLFMTTGAVDLEPITGKSGATVSVEDGRRLLLMVSAATGIFEHYFGDPSTGNLATATAMERPMELMFRARQEMWRGVFERLLGYVVDSNGLATKGMLPADVSWDDDGRRVVQLGLPSDATNVPADIIVDDGASASDKERIERDIDIIFPSILEKDPTSRVATIISAATLDGKTLAGTIPSKKDLALLLCQAAGIENAEELIDEWFDEDGTPKVQPDDPNKGTPPVPPTDPNAPADPNADANAIDDSLAPSAADQLPDSVEGDALFDHPALVEHPGHGDQSVHGHKHAGAAATAGAPLHDPIAQGSTMSKVSKAIFGNKWVKGYENQGVGIAGAKRGTATPKGHVGASVGSVGKFISEHLGMGNVHPLKGRGTGAKRVGDKVEVVKAYAGKAKAVAVKATGTAKKGIDKVQYAEVSVGVRGLRFLDKFGIDADRVEQIVSGIEQTAELFAGVESAEVREFELAMRDLLDVLAEDADDDDDE